MGAITFVNEAHAGSAVSNDGTVTVNVPASTADDDIMLLVITTNNTADPAGLSAWTVALDDVVVRTGEHAHVYWRRAASEPASYTFTCASATMSVAITSFRGVDLFTPFDVAAAAGSVVTSGTTITAPGVTTTVGYGWMVSVYISRNDNNPAPFSQPSGMTERYDFHDVTSGTGVYNQSLNTQEFVSPGASGTKVSTTTNAITLGAVGISMVLRPNRTIQQLTPLALTATIETPEMTGGPQPIVLSGSYVPAIGKVAG